MFLLQTHCVCAMELVVCSCYRHTVFVSWSYLCVLVTDTLCLCHRASCVFLLQIHCVCAGVSGAESS